MLTLGDLIYATQSPKKMGVIVKEEYEIPRPNPRNPAATVKVVEVEWINGANKGRREAVYPWYVARQDDRQAAALRDYEDQVAITAKWKATAKLVKI